MNRPVSTASASGSTAQPAGHLVAVVKQENPVAGTAHPAWLNIVREQAATEGVPYAGSVSPQQAWQLFVAGDAFIVDVRTVEERKFVGHVPGTVHVAWQTGTALVRNPRFTRELEQKVSKDAIVLLLCRSGKRSAQAAEAATRAGFRHVFNIREGFEGDLDDESRRGLNNGWRHHNLPWQQD